MGRTRKMIRGKLTMIGEVAVPLVSDIPNAMAEVRLRVFVVYVRGLLRNWARSRLPGVGIRGPRILDAVFLNILDARP